MNAHFHFPQAAEYKLQNGAHLTLMPDYEQQTAVVCFLFPVGRAQDAAGEESCCEHLVQLMTKGTQKRDFETFSQQLESAGTSLFFEPGDEHVIFGARCLAKSLDQAIEMLWEMITAPELNADELKRIKKESLTALQASSAEASVLAARHFSAQLFGKNHPLGRVQTSRTIRKVKADTLKRFYETWIRPQGMQVIVAGAFEVESSLHRWMQLFSSWDHTETQQPHYIDPPESYGYETVRLIDKPDLSQSTIMLGHAMPGELDENKISCALGNYILGGGNFSSRLMKRIRSEKGRTYGISSAYSTLRTMGTLSISTATKNENVVEMIELILQELRRFSIEGITHDELDKARKYIVGDLSFQLEGIHNLAEKWLWLKQYERTFAYISGFPALLNSLSLTKVNSVISRHFRPDDLQIVVVGKRKEIEPLLNPYFEKMGKKIKNYSWRANP